VQLKRLVWARDCSYNWQAGTRVTIDWTAKETTTHQDHVIAHVIGATVLGYFVFDEALYILLDIGFVWTIFLDGEMGLLPHPVAISELEINEQDRGRIKAEIDLLLGGHTMELVKMKPPPADCRIEDVSYFAQGDQRRLLITGEEANLAVETSLTNAEIKFYDFREE
jgi:hypothetical protein